MTFSPKIQPEDFKATFTTAEGWGQFTQQVKAPAQTAKLELKYSHLNLKTFKISKVHAYNRHKSFAYIDGDPLSHSRIQEDDYWVFSFGDKGIHLKQGQVLGIKLS